MDAYQAKPARKAVTKAKPTNDSIAMALFPLAFHIQLMNGSFDGSTRLRCTWSGVRAPGAKWFSSFWRYDASVSSLVPSYYPDPVGHGNDREDRNEEVALIPCASPGYVQTYQSDDADDDIGDHHSETSEKCRETVGYFHFQSLLLGGRRFGFRDFFAFIAYLLASASK